MEIKRNLNTLKVLILQLLTFVSISYGDKEKFEPVGGKQLPTTAKFQSPMEIKRNLNLSFKTGCPIFRVSISYGDKEKFEHRQVAIKLLINLFQSPMEIKRNLNTC